MVRRRIRSEELHVRTRVGKGSRRDGAQAGLRAALFLALFPPMILHAVYFWLRPDLTPAEEALYNQRLAALLTIDGIVHGHIGVPAVYDRPVIDRSYSRSLVLAFRDAAAHDAYQVDPVHDAFRTECHTFWTRVQIYDSIGS